MAAPNFGPNCDLFDPNLYHPPPPPRTPNTNFVAGFTSTSSYKLFQAIILGNLMEN